ncbi:MAG: hypothetical protein C0462_06850 [Alcanivorax sp.]|nr:hypothetical protein [Alcanivorax sp.]
MSGTPVEVLISGEVPAQLQTGDISVTIISDAVGYLLPNESSDDRFAPRHVRMWMDVAMTAEGTEANAALTQDVMHVEVVGIAIIENGVLSIDAVAAIELDVLGIDRAIGALAFRLEGYDHPNLAPPQQQPAGLATLQSWLPADQVDRARPGDPIILTFDRPIYRDSVKPGTGALSVTRNGVEVDYNVRADGSALVVEPEGGLAFNDEYTININGAARDLYGNPIGQDYSLHFTMPLFREYLPGEIKETFEPESPDGSQRFLRVPMSARAVTTYPGYPCATEARAIADGLHGRCVGSRTGSPASWETVDGAVVATNEILPVTTLPANRDIRVRFSKPMDQSSIRLGDVNGVRVCGVGTFRVERMNDAGTDCIAPVPGRLELAARSARFVPDEPWESGVLYRYTMVSNGSIRGSNPHRTDLNNARADCATGNVICSADSLPLMTRFFSSGPGSAPTHTGGGPNMEIFFRGAEPTTAVFQSMVTLPTPDVNANSILDEEERPDLVLRDNAPANSSPYEIPLNGTWLSVNRTAGQINAVRLGCSTTGPACPENAFIYINGGLDADIIGYDESEDAVRVDLYPTMIATTGVDLYATSGVGEPRSPAPKGPQFMRTRYALDQNGVRSQPITGWIRRNESDPSGAPIFEAELGLLVDAPQLDARVYAVGITPSINHNIRSLAFSLSMRGPVTFLEDGRMVIAAVNAEEALLETRLDVDVPLLQLRGRLIWL